jgi:hypothetical protein
VVFSEVLDSRLRGKHEIPSLWDRSNTQHTFPCFSVDSVAIIYGTVKLKKALVGLRAPRQAIGSWDGRRSGLGEHGHGGDDRSVSRDPPRDAAAGWLGRRYL